MMIAGLFVVPESLAKQAIDPPCPKAGEKRFNYSHVDMDGDEYFIKLRTPGKICGSSFPVRVEATDGDGRKFFKTYGSTVGKGEDCNDADSNGWFKVPYTHVDADADGYFIKTSGTLCSNTKSLPQVVEVRGAKITYSSKSPKPTLDECDSNPSGWFLTPYSLVDRDGDGFFSRQPGKVCSSFKVLASRQTVTAQVFGKKWTYANQVPNADKGPKIAPDWIETASNDLKPSVPMAPLAVASPTPSKSPTLSGTTAAGTSAAAPPAAAAPSVGAGSPAVGPQLPNEHGLTEEEEQACEQMGSGFTINFEICGFKVWGNNLCGTDPNSCVIGAMPSGPVSHSTNNSGTWTIYYSWTCSKGDKHNSCSTTRGEEAETRSAEWEPEPTPEPTPTDFPEPTDTGGTGYSDPSGGEL
jgi:hypothetical protein